MHRIATYVLLLMAAGCDSSRAHAPAPAPAAAPTPAPTPTSAAAPAAPAATTAAPPPVGEAVFDLRQQRRIAVGETVDPPALTVDGDFLYFQSHSLGKECGSLYKSSPHEAVFVLCGGEVLAGPLTTAAQIEEVFGLLSDRSKNAHDATMAVINNYPTGGNARYRVYDQHGRYLGER